MNIEDVKYLSQIDAAWITYKRMGLPSPAASRLVTRGSVPEDHLEFFREHYAIPSRTRIGLEFANLPNPGYVRVFSPRDFLIVLNSSYRGWHDAETAVLSHEMAHVVMKVQHFSSEDRALEEVYTDAFAVFLGSGLLANFAESVEHYNTGTMLMRLGYLDKLSRSYAMSVFLSAANISHPDHPSGAWRNSDLQGLDMSCELLKSRNVARSRLSRANPPTCPVCQILLTVCDRQATCPRCLHCWSRGLIGWREISERLDP